MGVPVKARASTADKVTPMVTTHNGGLAFANVRHVLSKTNPVFPLRDHLTRGLDVTA
jgi:hypothetical protein